MKAEATEYGPKMLALRTDQMREFCEEYVRNGGNAVQASRAAGYKGDKMSGWRLLQRGDVQEALSELCQTSLRGLTPAAVKAMGNLLQDTTHKDHAKTVFAVLDRTGLNAVTEHKTTVTIDDRNVRSAIRKLAAELSVDVSSLYPALRETKVIELKPELSEDEEDDIGDLL